MDAPKRRICRSNALGNRVPPSLFRKKSQQLYFDNLSMSVGDLRRRLRFMLPDLREFTAFNAEDALT